MGPIFCNMLSFLLDGEWRIIYSMISSWIKPAWRIGSFCTDAGSGTFCKEQQGLRTTGDLKGCWHGSPMAVELSEDLALDGQIVSSS